MRTAEHLWPTSGYVHAQPWGRGCSRRPCCHHRRRGRSGALIFAPASTDCMPTNIGMPTASTLPEASAATIAGPAAPSVSVTLSPLRLKMPWSRATSIGIRPVTVGEGLERQVRDLRRRPAARHAFRTVAVATTGSDRQRHCRNHRHRDAATHPPKLAHPLSLLGSVRLPGGTSEHGRSELRSSQRRTSEVCNRRSLWIAPACGGFEVRSGKRCVAGRRTRPRSRGTHVPPRRLGVARRSGTPGDTGAGRAGRSPRPSPPPVRRAAERGALPRAPRGPAGSSLSGGPSRRGSAS